MKKKTVLWIILGAVAALAIAAFALGNHYAKQARSLYASCQYVRATMHKWVNESTLTVTENGELVGEFTLDEIRSDAPNEQIDAMFAEQERQTVDAFRAQSFSAQLDWWRDAQKNPRPWYWAATNGTPLSLKLDDAHWDLTPVFDALDKTERSAPVNSVAVRINGGYEITPEREGTTLDQQIVRAGLLSCLNAEPVELNMDSSYHWVYELTDDDCYEHPTVTRETAFDYDALLQRDAAGLALDIDIKGSTYSLSVLDYVYMDGNKMAVYSQKLQEELAKWAQETDEHDVPYRFQSEDRGEVEIPFMICNYVIDTDELQKHLERQLKMLAVMPITAPILCTDAEGEPYGLGDTYIAVDKEAQTITYYQDGELIVHSDVVTGMPWGGHDTPAGLYDVDNKQTDCWLIGSDFYVHVDYWLGFIGTMYGLHDADWRDTFGSDRYKNNGSHGCVNIPKEVVAKIYEKAAIGTPVLVFEK